MEIKAIRNNKKSIKKMKVREGKRCNRKKEDNK